MNDMERRNFEESFKKAFQEAEVQPSDNVWTNVELDLSKAEGEKMKRRVLFYQMLAAASISFAILVTGFSFYVMNDRSSEQLALAGRNDNNALTQDVNANQTQISDANLNSQKSAGNSTDSESNTTQSLPSENETARELALNSKATNSENVSKTRSDVKAISPDHNATQFVPNAISPDLTYQRSITGDQQQLSLMHQRGSRIAQRNSAENSVVDLKESGTQGSVAVISSGMENNSSNDGANMSVNGSRKLPALANSNEPVLTFNSKEEGAQADPVALMFARLKDLEKELSGEETGRKRADEAREKLWTSVAFAAGPYNTISPAGGPTVSNPSFAQNSMLTTNSSVVDNQTKASGVTYTLGVSMGTQITERLVLQGGLNYLTEMSDYTSTQAKHDQSGNFKAASINDIKSDANSSRERFIPTAPYTVNNSNEYLSIPVQAGYLIVKKKIVWQLNAGVSTDFFLQNTIDPEGNIEKTTQGAGDQSPYRTVNFSGLIGSEVSYKFGDRYRLGINPGIRYPFSSIFKEDIGIQSTPITFDVGLRFRYIFR